MNREAIDGRRQRYESGDDLRLEAEVRIRLEARWSVRLHKLAEYYGADFAAVRGRDILGLVEVKSRKYAMAEIDRMGGYYLSALKWSRAQHFSAMLGVPFRLVVNAIDGLWMFEQRKGQVFDRFVLAGRKDRNDWRDIEPHVVIPVSAFRVRIGDRVEIKDDGAPACAGPLAVVQPWVRGESSQ